MDIEELYKYAYLKRPLNESFKNPKEVPYEFLMEWFKETFDYQRIHSAEEIKDFINLKPEDILNWLEEVQRLVWETKKKIWFVNRFEL